MKRYLKINYLYLYKFFAFCYRKLIFLKLKFFSGSKRKIFFKIYKYGKWKGNESISGTGSNLEQTKNVRKELPHLFKKLKINSILDCPCGDFYWMNSINLEEYNYEGYDIVPELIESNTKKYRKKNISFRVLDITEEILEKADLILMRDLLVHLSFKDIQKTLTNIKKSNSRFLLTTNFSKIESNYDIATGQWRPINLELPPFNLPKPKIIINELNTEYNNEIFKSKDLSLWEINELKF